MLSEPYKKLLAGLRWPPILFLSCWGEKIDICLHMVIERCLVWVDPFKITILHKLNHA